MELSWTVKCAKTSHAGSANNSETEGGTVVISLDDILSKFDNPSFKAVGPVVLEKEIVLRFLLYIGIAAIQRKQFRFK